jgi:hypothetical protein
MRPQAEAKIARLSEAPSVSFGPLAHYQRLTGEDGLPVFTGVQTCQPGYATPRHCIGIRMSSACSSWKAAWKHGWKASKIAPRDSRPAT